MREEEIDSVVGRFGMRRASYIQRHPAAPDTVDGSNGGRYIEPHWEPCPAAATPTQQPSSAVHRGTAPRIALTAFPSDGSCAATAHPFDAAGRLCQSPAAAKSMCVTGPAPNAGRPFSPCVTSCVRTFTPEPFAFRPPPTRLETCISCGAAVSDIPFSICAPLRPSLLPFKDHSRPTPATA